MSARYTVLAIPGTSESWAGDTRTAPYGMLSLVTAQLDPAVFQCAPVNYPADFIYPFSENGSMQACLTHLEQMIRDTPLPVILLAYSQGAQVAREFLAALRLGVPSVQDLVVVGAGLVADPNRSQGVQEGPILGGSGIAGPAGAWASSLPVWEIVSAGDPIANAPHNSLLRPIAPALMALQLTDPASWVNAAAKLLNSEISFEDGRWILPGELGPGVVGALCEIYAYAFAGAHTTAYSKGVYPGTTRTFCEHLADLITERFR